MPELLKTGFTRIFSMEGGANPGTRPVYEGEAMAGAVDWSLGDVTPVRIPSRTRYDEFKTVTTLRGALGLPTMSFTARKLMTRSRLLQLARAGCPVTLQIHAGDCGNPADFNFGWTDGFVAVLDLALPTNYSTDALGALEPEARAMVNEDVPWTGQDYYELYPLTWNETATSEITDEVVDIDICDSQTCANCGLPSDGCQVVLALVGESSGSPGIAAAVVYTKNGGASWDKSPISSLGIGDDADALACLNQYVVVVSNGGSSYHYLSLADLTDGLGGFTAVSSLVAAPNAIDVADGVGFIACDGGYILRLDQAGETPTTQTDGSITSENLLDIDALDDQNAIAVGANNAVLVTDNGGVIWRLVTGPAPAVQLNTVHMASDQVWHVGDAAGNLHYTRDAGATWTTKSFPGSGNGSVEAVTFINQMVGFLSHTLAGTGRIFRTIDGGYSWFIQPQTGKGIMPTADKFNEIAACADPNANIVFAGGLGADGQDGIAVKGAA